MKAFFLSILLASPAFAVPGAMINPPFVSGGVKTYSQGYEIRAFKTVGSQNFRLYSGCILGNYEIIAGAGGASIGGSGAGGMLRSTITICAGTYASVVGDGGAGSTDIMYYNGTNGYNSTFLGFTAIGGGAGGGRNLNADNGGCGGGAGTGAVLGGSGSQGYNGGNSIAPGAYPSGGGGGMGGAGQTSPNTSTAGDGGTGIISWITGECLCEGGGGGIENGGYTGGHTSCTGGAGASGAAGTAAAANTGSGSGGGISTGQKGGSGRVTLRFRI